MTELVAQPRPAHSPIGASSMHRWANCPGSVKLSENIQRKSSEAAAAGTLAHEIADKYFQIYKIDTQDPEMYAAIETYVDFVRKNTYSATWHKSELAFDLGQIHPNLYGRCDYVAYFAKRNLLRVYDFKYGKGHAVEVENNEQLLYYALGAIINHPQFRIREIELIIIQPRAKLKGKAIRKWRFDALHTMTRFTARLKGAAMATENPNAELKLGSWCYWCPANFKCPLKLEKKADIAKEVFANIADF